MNTDTKVKWLGSLLGVCLIAVVVESYYLWSDHKSSLDSNMQAITNSSLAPVLPQNWNPNTQFKQMQQQMNQLMNQMSTASSMFDQRGFRISATTPKISMRDEADKYKVIVDVPKGQKVEINTNLSGNQLTVDGKVKQTNTSQSNGSQERALSVSQFSQTMQFPEPVKDSGVKIQRNDNQIVITVPKVG